MPRSRDGGRLPVTDLTNGHYPKLSGTPVVEIAQATLAASASLIDAWRDLEPIVRTLTTRVKAAVDQGKYTGPEAMRLLGSTATVVQKLGGAAQGMLRASDGMHRLGTLLDEGTHRVSPAKLTQKQLASLVLETAKQIATEQGHCPICQPPPVEVTPAPETVQ